MRVIIAEDNSTELNYFKRLLEKENDVHIIGEAHDGQDALELLLKLKPDAAFLDISMPGLTGMELAERLDGKVFVVFITAHNDFALDAFNAGTLDYLLKPVDPQRLKLTIKRLKRMLSFKYTRSGKITVNIKGTLVRLDINEILYLEKIPLVKKIIIHMKDKEYKVSGTLDKFEDKLNNYGFARSHKSFIININKVDRLIPWGDSSYLIKLFGTKKEVMVSRHFAPLIKSLIND
ncbi:MAG: LytTR family DNA-binding domain-containing protein [Firmicutes bacterium]|nr:LytTR family DNA-binding domain-containing protein [Bacillota bacterium]